MTGIALVISDVDGTLVTGDKRLTDAARAAVKRLRDAKIGFTITSSRPPVGLKMLIEPLALDLPIGAFNGSSIVDPKLNELESHLIPVPAVRTSLDVLREFAVDAWVFTQDQWLIHNSDGVYVAHEQQTIQFAPTVVEHFSPYFDGASKIVGASDDFALLERCERALQEALGAQASAVRSQRYYLDVTPPGCDKGSFVAAMAQRLGIATDAIASIGDMANDLPMLRASGLSVAMGNAPDEVKKEARHVTASNEDDGFAKAVDLILSKQQH
uniref:Cof-like hydrolase n=1 Tax=Rhodopseudomonas palustris (strain BisA53) TaxID=316055 RepID=Q07K92_RHOP5